ncbi:hypothetical protein JL721_11 [Aureococcus anophagefferens]|nr:hypothetical protein JL721_11 [Aureococcus anophagefferens]
MNPIARPVILQVAEPVAPPQLKAGFHRTAKQPLLKQKTKKLMMVQKSVAAIMQAAKKPVVGRAKSWVTKKQKPSKLVDVFLQFDHDDANALDYAKLEALHRFYGEPLDAHQLRDDVDTFGDDYGAIDRGIRAPRGGSGAAASAASRTRPPRRTTPPRRGARRSSTTSSCAPRRPTPAAAAPRKAAAPQFDRPLSGLRTSADTAARSGLNWGLLNDAVKRRAEDRAELAYKPEPPRRKRGGRRRVVPV